MSAKLQEDTSTDSDHLPDLLGELVGVGSSALRRQEADGGESLHLQLTADSSAPQRARRAVETLGDQLSLHTVADLRAVVTELVTICLSDPTGDRIEVRLEIQDGRVHGEIGRIGGAGGEISGAGHALRIVGALVEEWGLRPAQSLAWFRIAGPD
ncbi:MAG TPA: hypothetical protein VGV69_02160 [Solirubrobacterales bacterium]|nr:hypothetical protein [Solirubrobacterales bacterium]